MPRHTRGSCVSSNGLRRARIVTLMRRGAFLTDEPTAYGQPTFEEARETIVETLSPWSSKPDRDMQCSGNRGLQRADAFCAEDPAERACKLPSLLSAERCKGRLFLAGVPAPDEAIAIANLAGEDTVDARD